MNLPLYRSVREHHASARSIPNASLIFDRFVEWDRDWKAGGSHKQTMFEKVADYQADVKLLDDFLDRQEQQVEALGGTVREAETSGRFVSGLGGAHPFETGFVWHRTLGVPYLPGSSVKGAVRAWTEQWSEEKDEAAFLFGGTEHQGAMTVLDALPTKPPRLEVDVMTPHYSEYYGDGRPPGDYLSPVPVPFLVVAAGSTFRFSLAPREKGDEESLQRAIKLLEDALENIGAGAKTSVGYGTFTVKAPKKDLRLEQMRARIEAQNPNDIGSVPGLVDELANLPAGRQRTELAELLYATFLSDGKRRRRHREKDWFENLQRMRDNG